MLVTLRELGYRLGGLLVSPRQDPVFVLGNQKSGTSAIAALLASATGCTLTLDIRRAIADCAFQLRILYGLESFASFVKKYRWEFSRKIIKEPALTFFVRELVSVFPDASYIFVVRDPRDNIRSILDRLGLSGGNDLDISSEVMSELPPAWRLVMDSRWLGEPFDSHIEALAKRWNVAADAYLSNRQLMHLVRYEDFMKDKATAIFQAAAALQLPVQRDISSLLDIQYQPRGHAGISWDTFFGTANRQLIESECRHSMRELGYETANEQ